MTRPSLALALLSAGLLVALARGAEAPLDEPAFALTQQYESRVVEGWTVLVNRDFLAGQPELAERALTLLRSQLDQVVRRLPGEAVATLRGVKIWLEEAEPHHPCMAYHPDAGWLKAHGMNPEKARCVEIANARNFLKWTLDQPWMVLHELAHGYHHQALEAGFANSEVEAAYRRAMEAGSYRSVLRINGREEKAYAATNPMEYFAEGTEAFFGANDFYPFVRPELRKHDPDLCALLGKLWGSK